MQKQQCSSPVQLRQSQTAQSLSDSIQASVQQLWTDIIRTLTTSNIMYSMFVLLHSHLHTSCLGLALGSLQCKPATLQSEPAPGEIPCVVQNILLGPCTAEGMPQCLQKLYISGIDITHNKGFQKTNPEVSLNPAQILTGPSPVCYPDANWRAWCHLHAPLHPPGQAGGHCEGYVF